MGGGGRWRNLRVVGWGVRGGGREFINYLKEGKDGDN